MAGRNLAISKNGENDVGTRAVRQQVDSNVERSLNNPSDHILSLQRMAGNQAVESLFRSGAIQAKLELGRPNDMYEREADRVASKSTVQREPEPTWPNNTGLPDDLKTGVESLSGMSLDHVNVHYNSSQPAQLNALAYAQGSNIHVAPGQERHLPHEAWHVVQQAQGRVQPTIQMKDGVAVNDDAGLEHEADVMGGRALQAKDLQADSCEKVRSVGLTPLASPLQSPMAAQRAGVFQHIGPPPPLPEQTDQPVLSSSKESSEHFLNYVWDNRQNITENDIYRYYSLATKENPLEKRTQEDVITKINNLKKEFHQLIYREQPEKSQNPSFYHFYNYDISNQASKGQIIDQQMERIYLTLRSDDAPEVMNFVLQEIVSPVENQVIGAKIAGPQLLPIRSESIVIYCTNTDSVDRALEKIRNYQKKFPKSFLSGGPAFTEEVLPGVSLGLEPSNEMKTYLAIEENFGVIRSKLVMRAINESLESGETMEQFFSRVVKYLNTEGINQKSFTTAGAKIVLQALEESLESGETMEQFFGRVVKNKKNKGESFGTARSKIVFQAVKDSVKFGESKEQFFSRADGYMKYAGIIPDKPYLNLSNEVASEQAPPPKWLGSENFSYDTETGEFFYPPEKNEPPLESPQASNVKKIVGASAVAGAMLLPVIEEHIQMLGHIRDSRLAGSLATLRWWLQRGIEPTAFGVTDRLFRADEYISLHGNGIPDALNAHRLNGIVIEPPDAKQYKKFESWVQENILRWEDVYRHFILNYEAGIRLDEYDGWKWKVRVWKWSDFPPANVYEEVEEDETIKKIMEPILERVFNATAAEIAAFAQGTDPRKKIPDVLVDAPKQFKKGFLVDKNIYSPLSKKPVNDVTWDFEPKFHEIPGVHGIPSNFVLVGAADVNTYILIHGIRAREPQAYSNGPKISLPDRIPEISSKTRPVVSEEYANTGWPEIHFPVCMVKKDSLE